MAQRPRLHATHRRRRPPPIASCGSERCRLLRLVHGHGTPAASGLTPEPWRSPSPTTAPRRGVARLERGGCGRRRRGTDLSLPTDKPQTPSPRELRAAIRYARPPSCAGLGPRRAGAARRRPGGAAHRSSDGQDSPDEAEASRARGEVRSRDPLGLAAPDERRIPMAAYQAPEAAAARPAAYPHRRDFTADLVTTDNVARSDGPAPLHRGRAASPPLLVRDGRAPRAHQLDERGHGSTSQRADDRPPDAPSPVSTRTRSRPRRSAEAPHASPRSAGSTRTDPRGCEERGAAPRSASGLPKRQLSCRRAPERALTCNERARRMAP